jgi:hypothetical protein
MSLDTIELAIKKTPLYNKSLFKKDSFVLPNKE